MIGTNRDFPGEEGENTQRNNGHLRRTDDQQIKASKLVSDRTARPMRDPCSWYSEVKWQETR